MPMINSVFYKGGDNARLTTTQAANYLGFSKKTLDNWAYQGQGPTYSKIGNRRFYTIEELKRFIRDGNYEFRKLTKFN